MLLELLAQDHDRIVRVGEMAREKAWAGGVPVYYIDEKFDPQGRIIEHHPDGRMVFLDADD